MYPTLFRPFGFEISTFGLMVAIGFLVATWITTARMREEGLDPDHATTLLLYIMVGGMVGAKLYFAIDTSLRRDIDIVPLLLSRDGITWYGGLIGATLVGAIGCRVHDIPVKMFANCVCVGAAVGQALGRVGCFLVGDDYGSPTDLPWGIAFPLGAPPTMDPVHPTQIYEILWLLPVAGLLWRRRHRSPFLFGEYIALNGLGRLVIESWRVNPRMLLGLTEPQIIGVALMVIGSGIWLYHARSSSQAPA